MHKFILAAILLIHTSLSVFAQDQKKILATASMISDMAKQIAGDKLSVDCIVPIGGDPHLYDPVPSDARKVARADLILKNDLAM